MTEPRTLPHDPYITAVVEALTDTGLDPAGEVWTSDAESAGSYRYLSATIILTPDTTAIDPARWPHGLLLRWEWHTGTEAADGEPERGPAWTWAKRARRDNSEPELLPVDGYANPVQVTAAAHELAASGAAVKPRPGRWAAAAGLDQACAAWAADEADGGPPPAGATAFEYGDVSA